MDSLDEHIVTVLHSRIKGHIEAYSDSLASGACSSFEEYRRMIGVIEGLRKAESELRELVERYQEAE